MSKRQEALDYHSMGRKGKIEVITKNKPDKPIFIKADRKRIMEVLTNLTINAIKYGKRKGKVEISFHEMEDNIIVEISDDGRGIDSEKIKSKALEKVR